MAAVGVGTGIRLGRQTLCCCRCVLADTAARLAIPAWAGGWAWRRHDEAIFGRAILGDGRSGADGMTAWDAHVDNFGHPFNIGGRGGQWRIALSRSISVAYEAIAHSSSAYRQRKVAKAAAMAKSAA